MMDKAPVITLIIPTYKRPELLRRALKSALNQTFTSFQICIYDNASGDETREVVEEFMNKDPRVKYHCHPENIGMIGNYEFALDKVETPYFSLLSDDDLLFPEFFKEALKGFHQFPDSAFSAVSTLVVSEKGEVIRVPLDLWSREGYFPATEALPEMISKYPIPTCILFRREVIKEVPIDRDNALTWDCDFLLQIAARYPIFISKEPCGIFLHHNNSYSHSQDFEKWEYSIHRMKKRVDCLNQLSPESKNLVSYLFDCDLKAHHRVFILHSLFNKKTDKACEYAMNYIRNYGSNFSSLLLLTICKVCFYFSPAVYFFLLIRKIYKIRKSRARCSFDFSGRRLRR